MASRKNGTAVVEPENTSVAEAESVINDLQAVGEARLSEVVESVRRHAAAIIEARQGIVADLRTIQSENLWVFARNADGDAYIGWKPFVTDLLTDALSGLGEKARKAFVVMLVDEGFTPVEAAKVMTSATGEKVTTGEANKAIVEANAQSEGTEPPVPTPPVELTGEQKATKIANQSLAQNKKLLDVLFDLPVSDLEKLVIDHESVVTQLKGMLNHKKSDTISDTSAA